MGFNLTETQVNGVVKLRRYRVHYVDNLGTFCGVSTVEFVGSPDFPVHPEEFVCGRCKKIAASIPRGIMSLEDVYKLVGNLYASGKIKSRRRS